MIDFMLAAVVSAFLNIGLLLVTVGTYIQNMRVIRSYYTFGLVLVASMLMLQNIVIVLFWFTLYMDDGISLNYLKGKVAWIRMKWDDAARELTLEPDTQEGAERLSVHQRFIIELLPKGTTKHVNYVDKEIQVRF